MKDCNQKGRIEFHTSGPKGLAGWKLGVGAAALVGLSLFGLPTADVQAQHSPHIHGSQTPDYHEVRSGDTFWDLSGTYFGDNYQWPRMWSYNPHITNPHWIYPGDIIHLREVDTVPDTGLEGEMPEDRGPLLGEEDAIGLYMAMGGMIVTQEETPVGRIIGSPVAARMLAEHQEVFVGFGEQAYREDERETLSDDEMIEAQHIDAQVGDRFAIIRQDGTIEDSEGEVTGYKYYVLGSLEITKVPEDDQVARTAMIDKSWREIERGDLLVPYERQLQLIQPRESDTDLVATVIDSLDPGAIFGPQEYLFINRGAEHGVRPGNRFFVYQQWEGFDHPHEKSAPEIPWQQVGQVMVLSVREQHSMVVITRSDREVLIGDRLEMYQGH